MFRTAFIVTIGLVVLSSVGRADPLVDAFVDGFNKGKQAKPKCDIECVRSSGGSLGSVPASMWPQQQRTAPAKSAKTGLASLTTSRTGIRR